MRGGGRCRDDRQAQGRIRAAPGPSTGVGARGPAGPRQRAVPPRLAAARDLQLRAGRMDCEAQARRCAVNAQRGRRPSLQPEPPALALWPATSGSRCAGRGDLRGGPRGRKNSPPSGQVPPRQPGGVDRDVVDEVWVQLRPPARPLLFDCAAAATASLPQTTGRDNVILQGDRARTRHRIYRPICTVLTVQLRLCIWWMQ
jgi:hypothetical protein